MYVMYMCRRVGKSVCFGAVLGPFSALTLPWAKLGNPIAALLARSQLMRWSAAWGDVDEELESDLVRCVGLGLNLLSC